ncbi:MAG TPA: hydroxymethylglutaryl-CoA lyase [Candidatus Acidoferrales bacterium]|nr:hydroxymethylglutaryl-CoA lyase [Candidatus Acidoferrales bacterium]
MATDAGHPKGSAAMREKVKVVDVTARDGLQNEPKPVSTRDKLALIDKLVQAGVTDIQATSFVHPKWVPQMADAEDVAAGLGQYKGIKFSALVPNLKGYERALAAGIRNMEFVIAASETFNRKNLNRSMAESLQLLEQATRLALRDGVVLRAGFSTCFHCQFEGRISSQAVVNLARAAREIHPWRIAVCDTDGMAFPDQVKEIVNQLVNNLKMNPTDIVLHFHDTYGRGLANTLAGLQAGVREYDSCTAGLGGCPYCPGASGNLATEDLVDFLEGMGYDTGIHMEKLLDAAEFASRFSSRSYQGHLLRARRAGACGVASAVSI